MRFHKAAVIVLYEMASDSLILTARTPTLRHHPGEICFPGGRSEQRDKSLRDTALRELKEELGIDKERLSVQRELETVKTLTGYFIYPWLAFIPHIEPYQLNSTEVAAIIRIPMARVREPANYQAIVVEKNGLVFESHQFLDETHYIWGATVRIMMQLSEHPLAPIYRAL